VNGATDKVIEIVVTPTGETTVQTKGFTGPSCRGASRFIEQALGQVSAERTTAEFHAQQPDQLTIRRG
jgi:hypothetical protein